MTLHKKTLLIISITLAVLLLVLYGTSQIILMSSFKQLEREAALLNVQRALNTLSNDIAALGSTTADWASWDETYRFIEDINPGYIESNLVDSTFTELGLNLLVFVDSSGRIIYKQAFDIEEEVKIPFPDEILKHLSSRDPLMHHSDIMSMVDGIVVFSGGPMLISSRPILSSNDEGPVRGALIMGRYLDAGGVEHLSEITQLALTLHIINEPGKLSDTLPSVHSFSDDNPVLIEALNSETIQGHAMVRDIYGEPALLLRIDMARTLYQQGRTTVNYFLLALLIAGLIFGFVIRVLLEKQVLLRLALFSENIINIGRKKDLSSRVVLSGDDEVSDLAREFNRMIEALEQSENKLSGARDELEEKVNTLQDEIANREKLEKDREKLITELREAALKVKTLKGLLPVCCSCNKIRDEKGNWNHVDVYIRDHSDAEITHGYCPDCEKKHFSKLFKK